MNSSYRLGVVPVMCNTYQRSCSLSLWARNSIGARPELPIVLTEVFCFHSPRHRQAHPSALGRRSLPFSAALLPSAQFGLLIVIT